MNKTNKKLIKDVANELARITGERGIDIQDIPEQELDRLVKLLVRRFWK